MIPRSPGYVSIGSRRYTEWQTLAFEATTEREEATVEEYTGPLVDHPVYERPTRNLPRQTTEISGKSMSQLDQETTNGSVSQDQTMDGSHLKRKDQRSTEIPSAIYTIKETTYANRGRDQPSEAIEGVKVIATEEIRHGAADPFHKRSSHQSDRDRN